MFKKGDILICVAKHLSHNGFNEGDLCYFLHDETCYNNYSQIWVLKNGVEVRIHETHLRKINITDLIRIVKEKIRNMYEIIKKNFKNC